MIIGLKGLAADGHEINCRTCRSGKTCNVANAHGYWVGACVRYSPEKPMTNADKIRQMTDYELAEWIAKHMYCAECMFFNDDNGTCNYEQRHGKGCNGAMLEWLKQEVQ